MKKVRNILDDKTLQQVTNEVADMSHTASMPWQENMDQRDMTMRHVLTLDDRMSGTNMEYKVIMRYSTPRVTPVTQFIGHNFCLHWDSALKIGIDS